MQTPASFVVTPTRKKRAKLVWRKRDRQDSRLYNLRLDINDLKQEIARLVTTRSILQAQTLNHAIDADGASYKAVVEYFRVFARGFLDSPFDALSYIDHAMAQDIRVNSFCGRNMVREQWQAHSVVFPRLRFQFIDAVVIPHSATSVVVKARAHFHSHVTMQTIAVMFPHVVTRQDLVRKLLGKPVADIGRYDFEIALGSFEILRCDVELDLVGCFARILTDVRDVAVLFNQALLADGFYIGEV